MLMNKAILKQALKFKNNNPPHSQIEKLYNIASDHQKETETIFIKSKYRQRAEILDYDLFFEFIGEKALNNKKISSFEEIEDILQSSTRKENIKTSGDSKSNFLRVFDNVILLQIEDEEPTLHKNPKKIKIQDKVLAVENGETFLNIYPLMSKFGFKVFVYLGGFSNTLTREFLLDKDIVFFLDYDIEAIRIYDSFRCKSKSFFKHPNIQSYFRNNGNQKLYLKQRANLPTKHTELQWLIDLIKENSAVVEQEIIE